MVQNVLGRIPKPIQNESLETAKQSELLHSEDKNIELSQNESTTDTPSINSFKDRPLNINQKNSTL